MFIDYNRCIVTRIYYSYRMSSSTSDTFRKRKHDKQFNKKSVHALYTRANVSKAIEEMSEEEFRR